jgi:nitrate reductase NapAB chaperone NapD
MPRAYVMIQTEPDKLDGVRQSLGRLSMSKAIVESLWPGELVVHIEGNDAKSLADALTGQLPAIEGVRRITVWTIA